jgi:probable phosphoglycerate mutase
VIVEVFFDGGCRSNPHGEAASGAVVRDLEGKTLRHVGRAIGIGSNNLAEWNGLRYGLEAALELGATEVRAFGDSKLVVEQFSGAYAIRAEGLREISLHVSKLAQQFPGGVVAQHVPRKQNAAADWICTAVLNGTYEPGDTAPPAGAPVSVTFVVDVTMDPKEAREAIAAGTSELDLRRMLAARAERALLLNGRVGGDAYRPARVKG